MKSPKHLSETRSTGSSTAPRSLCAATGESEGESRELLTIRPCCPIRKRPCLPFGAGLGGRRGEERASGPSDVEAEVHHVAVLHDVVLSLEAHLARLLGLRFPAQAHVVVVRDHLGANEALLEIGMDHARGLRRGGALPHGPGAHFLLAGGERGLPAQ